MKKYKFATVFALLFLTLGNSAGAQKLEGKKEAEGPGAHYLSTYTLYRGSPLAPDLEIYIATFDSIEGVNDQVYNFENCERAKNAFVNDPGFFGAKLFCKMGYHNKHTIMQDNAPSLRAALSAKGQSFWEGLKERYRIIFFFLVIAVYMGFRGFRKN